MAELELVPTIAGLVMKVYTRAVMVDQGEGVTATRVPWWCRDCGGEDGGGFPSLATNRL
jgi:hypothetical protein